MRESAHLRPVTRWAERLKAEEFQMKKLAIALTAVAASTAPAFAADMAPRAAAPVAYAPSWTGCYVGGGGGYGLWNQENTGFIDGPPRAQFTSTTTAGGRGYFGTVQGGCDYQFPIGSWNFVAGAFGDYDWSSLKGHLNPPAAVGLVGDEKMSSAWSVGGRIGWLAFPSLLTYFSAGYTEATFDRTNLSVAFGPPFFPLGLPTNAFIDKKTYRGWFLGAGDEYAINFLPGLFWKTEYRFSEFDRATTPVLLPTGLPSGVSDDSKKFVHTIRSELVYRFNWGGSAVPRY
jgi:outer membrane immunogenic protein